MKLGDNGEAFFVQETEQNNVNFYPHNMNKIELNYLSLLFVHVFIFFL